MCVHKNQVSSSSSLTRNVCSLCALCLYDYLLQSAENRLDSSLTKMNHPAALVGHVAQITAASRACRHLRLPSPPPGPWHTAPLLPSSPLCPSLNPTSSFLISLTHQSLQRTSSSSLLLSSHSLFLSSLLYSLIYLSAASLTGKEKCIFAKIKQVDQ